jgi:hypothetical protein
VSRQTVAGIQLRSSTDGFWLLRLERSPSFSDVMTIYPNHEHDPHDTDEVTFLHWLDTNGFPSVGRPHVDQECDDVTILRSVPTGKSLGIFRAVSSRDGEALARDGQTFYALKPVESRGAEIIAEIQFGDGVWMLAASDDLETPDLSSSEGAK